MTDHNMHTVRCYVLQTLHNNVIKYDDWLLVIHTSWEPLTNYDALFYLPKDIETTSIISLFTT